MQDWRREREREREGKKKRIRKKEKKNQNCSQLSLGLLPPLPCCYSLGSFLLTANSQISGKKNNNNGNCDNPSNWKAAFKLFFVLFRGYPSCCTMPHTTMVHTYSTLLCCTVQNVHPKKKKKKKLKPFRAATRCCWHSGVSRSEMGERAAKTRKPTWALALPKSRLATSSSWLWRENIQVLLPKSPLGD